jgi:hypothetical protein
VLEKVLIKRINYHVYANGYMNENSTDSGRKKVPSTQPWQLKILWNKDWQEEK